MPDILTQLKALKLHGMADSYAEPVSYTHLDVYKRQDGCC